MQYLLLCYKKNKVISKDYVYEHKGEIGVNEKKHLLNFAKMFIAPQTEQIELKPITNVTN
jgi:hypothetical protein